MHLHKKQFTGILSPNPTARLTLFLVTSTRMWWFVNWRNLESETVTDESENKKITAAEALKKLDGVKNFIEVKCGANVEQITVKYQKTTWYWKILKYFLSILFIRIVWKKSFILISVVFFCPNILYSGHLLIADTFLGTIGVRYRQVWLQ